MKIDQFLKELYYILYSRELTNLGKVNKIKEIDLERWRTSGLEPRIKTGEKS